MELSLGIEMEIFGRFSPFDITWSWEVSSTYLYTFVDSSFDILPGFWWTSLSGGNIEEEDYWEEL